MKKLNRVVVLEGSREEYLEARDQNINVLLQAIEDGAAYIIVAREGYLVFSNEAEKNAALREAEEAANLALPNGELTTRNVIWYV